ncbi:helix-turn-helix transcriptional regulator [Haloechinothrix salitolerans]|uniref:Multiprotein-bridging factor 1 family protein n=1 Tax=Haloechinothrix salitolerans TaxID=926830 RepID=A0ABW2BUY1_9PSEU
MSTYSRKGADSVRPYRSEPIGTVVRRARQERGLSQHALAEALMSLSNNYGVSRTEVARWERGKRVPGPYWRGWLSSVLDIPVERLGAAARTARAQRAGPVASVRTDITTAGDGCHG